jgi:hypothetical protein
MWNWSACGLPIKKPKKTAIGTQLFDDLENLPDYYF